MACNWELFELRVVFYLPRYPQVFSSFWNVSLDHKTLSIADFQGSNGYCNFKSVFAQLARLKTIPFTFKNTPVGQPHNPGGDPFLTATALERNKRLFAAAKLYVHRRDQSDLTSLTIGTGVMLKRVTIPFTASIPFRYVQLEGESADLVN
ncbi:MAG: hypothetical protein M3209_20715 [Acidobacteriota bacterium]|nr:hypothetical protein [Acidobacteriota bacterium]